MERLEIAIVILVLVSTLVGLYGWFGHDIPASQEQTYEEKTVNGEIPLSNIASAFWWAGIWTVVGGFLSYGFFWEVPRWPEKAVMIPSIGFLVAGFTYSVMKGLGLLGVASILNTTNFYLAVGLFSVFGLASGVYRRGVELW